VRFLLSVLPDVPREDLRSEKEGEERKRKEDCMSVRRSLALSAELVVIALSPSVTTCREVKVALHPCQHSNLILHALQPNDSNN
jgi:hypothetical protein